MNPEVEPRGRRVPATIQRAMPARIRRSAYKATLLCRATSRLHARAASQTEWTVRPGDESRDEPRLAFLGRFFFSKGASLWIEAAAS